MKQEEIHIGKIVEKAFNQSGLTKKELANAIGINDQNMKRHFESSDWSAIKLIKAGKKLNCDFGYLFQISTHSKKNPPKVVLQIEIEEDKIKDVLTIVENKDLYEILKQ